MTKQTKYKTQKEIKHNNAPVIIHRIIHTQTPLYCNPKIVNTKKSKKIEKSSLNPWKPRYLDNWIMSKIKKMNFNKKLNTQISAFKGGEIPKNALLL